MSKQGSETIGGAATRTSVRSRIYSAAAVAALLAVFVAAAAGADDKSPASPSGPSSLPQNVNVVNTPTVSVGNTPAVTISGTPSVNATVSNTASNPVQGVNVEQLARIPLQITNGCQGSGCQILLGFNKPGYRLVIENVAGSFTLAAGTTEAPLMFLQNSDNSHGGRWTFAGTLGPTVSGQVMAGFNQRTLAYFDSSDGLPAIYAFGNVASAIITITGYYENCAVTGCPAIV